MSTITEKKINLFEGDSGFSLEIIGRDNLIYREKGRCLDVEAEMLAGPPGIAVYRESIRYWREPYSKEIISTSDRERIIENIRDVFKYQGFDISVL